MDTVYSKQGKRALQRIRMPSGQCQACLSDKSVEKDYMITCNLCQSSIHIKHYGREIDESNTALTYDRWKCERCRMLLQLEADQKYAQIDLMQCHFCPCTRGILKRVIYNGNETIWLHPECSTWPYPIIYQKNNRRVHYSCEFPTRPTGMYWVNLTGLNQAACQICHKATGHKIKCMYYTCEKYYHCSCAKSIGLIRDLESMQFENCDTYIPPYCEEHLQLRISDCQLKANKYRNAGDEGKSSNFTQMMSAYQTQFNNMKKSAQKFKDEEAIRKQMEYQTDEKDDLIQELSFQDEDESFRSNHSSGFLDFVFDGEYPRRTETKKRDSFLFNPLEVSNYAKNDEMIPEEMIPEQMVNEQEKEKEEKNKEAENKGSLMEKSQNKINQKQIQMQNERDRDDSSWESHLEADEGDEGEEDDE